MGHYLISKINFNEYKDKELLKKYIYKILSPSIEYIKNDLWQGLPELMNKDNSFCKGSCNTQAWSVATLIEAINKLNTSF